MKESGFRRPLIAKLKTFGHALAVENPVDPGTPDVFGCVKGVCYWLELKYIPMWPVYDKDVFHVPEYTPQQRNWSRKHYRNGGRVFLFVRVENEFFLFHPQVAINNVNIDLSTRDFKSKALRHWKRRIDYNDLIKVVTHHGRAKKSK